MVHEHAPDSRRHVTSAGGLSVAPSLGMPIGESQSPPDNSLVDKRTFLLSLVSLGLGAAGAGASIVLVWLIALITYLAYFHRLSVESIAPATNRLGIFQCSFRFLALMITSQIVGIVSRSDIICCFRKNLDENSISAPTLVFGLGRGRPSQ